MPPVFEVDRPLPTHPSFDSDRTARAFWRLSYRCGRTYITGLDALGQEVLVRHEREQAASYLRRQRCAKPRNYCGPIIRQYNDFVFRREATGRDEEKAPVYLQLLEDADGRGTGLVKLMRTALKRAQIEREVYLLPDSTKPADGQMTQAQAKAQNVRTIIRLIGADSVIWWRDVDGVLAEALVLLTDHEGEEFARWYGPKTTQDIRLKQREEKDQKQTTVVASIEEEKAHPYGTCPLERLRPLFDDSDDCEASPGESQIAPLAELQQDVANKLSLLDSEIYDATFSQWIASGVDKNRVGELDSGTTRVICLPDPASRFDSIGADPAQANTLREVIGDTVRELYRIAEISAGNPTEAAAPESGIAKAFKFNGLAANLSALADACEAAENGTMRRIFLANNIGDAPVVDYPGDFDSPDFAAELETVIRVTAAGTLPATIKRHVSQRFADRCLSLDKDEVVAFEAELAALGVVDENTDPFNPARRMTGT